MASAYSRFAGEATPRAFTLRNMAGRVAEAGKVWEGMLSEAQSPRRAAEELQRM